MNATITDATTELPKWGKRHTVFLIVVIANFAVWLDEGMFGAVTPYWSKAIHLSASQIGTVSGAYLLGYFPLLLLAGFLADKFGAKRMLILCLIGCAITSAAMPFINSYEALFIRNIVFGIFFGFLWAPCNRMMTLWLPGHERAKFAAIWMSSTIFAFVVAAPLGLMLASNFVWYLPFIVVAVLGLVALYFLVQYTVERPEQIQGISKKELHYIYENRDPEKEIEVAEFHWRNLKGILSQRSVLFMIIATGLATAPTWLILAWGSYGLVHDFKIPAGSVSLLSSLCMMAVVIYAPFNGWVVNKIFRGRTRPVLALGPLLGGIGFLAIAFFNPNWIIWGIFAYALGFISDPMFWGTINPYWTGVAKPEYSGTLNGISAAAQVAVGYAIVSLSGTWVSQTVKGAAALDNIWLIGGIIFLVSIVPIYICREVFLAHAPIEEEEPPIPEVDMN